MAPPASFCPDTASPDAHHTTVHEMDAYIVESLTVRTECPHAHLVRRGILGKVVVDEDDVDLRQAIGIGSPDDELTVYGLDQQVATLIAVGDVFAHAMGLDVIYGPLAVTGVDALHPIIKDASCPTLTDAHIHIPRLGDDELDELRTMGCEEQECAVV